MSCPNSEMNYRLVRFVFLGLMLLSLKPATAQDLDTATIRGVLRDISGAVVPAASLQLADASRNRIFKSAADNEGRFAFTGLPAADYEVRVEARGFDRLVQKGISVVSGQTIHLNLTVGIERLQQEVNVTAAVGGIDLSKTVVGGALTRGDFDLIPLNGRDPLDLVFLFPGVTEQPFDTRDAARPANGGFLSDTPIEAGVFSLSGGRAFSNNLTLDGFDNNDDREARERVSYSREAIEEVQVITNQFSSEYGRASGGRVNLRTRSGSNQFHGSGQLFFQDESLNANGFFRNMAGEPRVSYQRRQTGFVFSGPIRRDRVFFLAAYERDENPDKTEINIPLPLQSNPRFPLPPPNVQVGAVIYRPSNGTPVVGGRLIEEVMTPAHRNFWMGRVDAAVGQRQNLFVRYDLSRGSSLASFSGGSRFPSTAVARGRDSQAWAVSDSIVLSPRSMVQGRFQYSRLLPSNLEMDSPQPVAVIVNGSAGFSAGGSASTFSSNRRGQRRETRQQMGGDFTFAGSRHTLKFGGDFQRVNSRDFDLFELNGIYTFSNILDFLNNQPSRFQQAVGDPQGRVSNTVAGIYFQEEYRLRPNFSLNFGLRYDVETALSRDKNNFGPRFSFAWDPFKSGRTLVRGGFGVFYNRVLLRTLGDFAGQSGLRFLDLRTAEDVRKVFPHLSLNEADQYLANLFPRILPNSPEIFAAASPAEDTRRVAPDLLIPYSEQASFGVEREVTTGWFLEMSYQFNRGVKLWRDHNINAPIPPVGGLLNYLLGQAFALKLDNTLYSNVRFDLGTRTSVPTPNGAVVKTPLVLGLNASTLVSGSSTTRFVRLLFEAVRPLRPIPELEGIDQLESSGSSTYNAFSLSLARRAARWASFRTSYTLSKLFEDTFINTATPQDEFDLAAERSLGNTDQRHRFLFQGVFEIPGLKVTVVPVLQFASGRPFTIGNGGSDRNLSDRATDRPNLIQPLPSAPTLTRRPGEVSSVDPHSYFALAPIGTSGNLGRNVGRGPAQRRIDMAVSRPLQWTERVRLRPQVEIFNLFNNAIFFVNGFVDINDSEFLQPRASRRPRTIQVSLQVEF